MATPAKTRGKKQRASKKLRPIVRSDSLHRTRTTNSLRKVAKMDSSSLQFRLTHPDRMVYPDVEITKRDVANYYVAVAKWMLPHVSGRPLTLVRCPGGLSGACFYQKHPPAGMPAAVEQIAVRESSETRPYAVIHDLEGLMALVQFGALEIHSWGCLADDIEHPDRMVFDLDPDPSVKWSSVIEAAFAVRSKLQDLKLISFVKTTGGKGLHVVVPLLRRKTWPEVKQFARNFANEMVSLSPDRYIATMSKAARRGKIFIDYLRNERGATSVVCYSTRAKAGGPVSMPITWHELRTSKSPSAFTIKNVVQRLRKLHNDPWKDLPVVRQSLLQ
jgi:bifunctional non-homologous end joining protein LigD